jgi:hypothetical protein
VMNLSAAHGVTHTIVLVVFLWNGKITRPKNEMEMSKEKDNGRRELAGTRPWKFKFSILFMDVG